MNRDERTLIRNSTAEFLIFTATGGEESIEVRYGDETIWASQKMMVVLFGVDVRIISEHLKNIFETEELDQNSGIRKFRNTARDGKPIQYKILQPGCHHLGWLPREFKRAMQFCQWAIQVLREFAIKGNVLENTHPENNPRALTTGDFFANVSEHAPLCPP
ncbi:hypothetical protein [Methanogenium organophilum]|uniref:Phosphoribosylaminoimidazolesuccinocarboxamide synthase n=1 Tax=Methanogenium organophilum TaxID=2199 RepID=A0A9X9S3U7_METOG|nr:hypothetical protein [Methanogenium organophilum]WAI01429.1 hypothetical protein OU421_00725 [Methanogenium organophilum]